VGDNVGVALRPVELQGERVRLRSTTPADVTVLRTILCTPGVAQWWPNVTREECEEIVTRADVPAFVVEFDGDAIGVIQYSEEQDPDYEHAGIDVAIHDAWQGRGLGTDAVRTLARGAARTSTSEERRDGFGTVGGAEGGLRMTDTAHVDTASVELDFEAHRRELTAYCYRMLGSAFEADDAVQETLVRAWRNFDRFEGRSSVRSWLYKIASNVCFDQLRGRQRRAMPIDVMAMGRADGPVEARLPESNWIGPIPDQRGVASDADPAEQAVARESVRLAFVAALQQLPPRQRAVLILREVLKWRAQEVAELLDTTVVSVNSALQRARATLAERDVDAAGDPEPLDREQEELLARYVDAFERFDIEELVTLLRDDATMSMPPYPLWLRGPDALRTWLLGNGSGCRGSRVAPLQANGRPAFAQWRPGEREGTYDAWAIHVLELSDTQIAGIDFFVDPELFPLFGVPVHLEA